METNNEGHADHARAGGPGHFTPAEIADGRRAIAATGGDETYAAARKLLVLMGQRLLDGLPSTQLQQSPEAALLRRLGLASSRPITRRQDTEGKRRYTLTHDGEALYHRIAEGRT